MRHSSLQERKRNKSQQKTNKSLDKTEQADDYDYYAQFQKFYAQAQTIKYIEYEYMKEFFNLGIQDFPSDNEIAKLQKHILDTSGWASQLKKNWNLEEKKVLIWIVGKLSLVKGEDIRNLTQEFWNEVSSMICRRDAEMCKHKWLSMQKIALQQQPFSPEEDRRLYDIIQQFQQVDQGQKWSQIAQLLNQYTNVYRSSKQCRERWLNHLNPNISKDPWNDQEDIILMGYVKEIGRRWAEISKLMDGRRSENTLKNRFNSLIKRERELSVIHNSKTLSVEQVLGGCQGSDLNDLQKKAIEAIIQKIKWRQGESQKKVIDTTVRNSMEKPPHEQVKRASLRTQTSTSVKYQVGQWEPDISVLDLVPCLVNMSKNLIYFCPSEIIMQVLSQAQQNKDSFERLKSEISLLDMGFHNFKSTLNMIEEIEDSQVSQSIQNNQMMHTDDVDIHSTNNVKAFIFESIRTDTLESDDVSIERMQDRAADKLKIFSSTVSATFDSIKQLYCMKILVLSGLLTIFIWNYKIFNPDIYKQLEIIEKQRIEKNLLQSTLDDFNSQYTFMELILIYKIQIALNLIAESNKTIKQLSEIIIRNGNLAFEQIFQYIYDDGIKIKQSSKPKDKFLYNFASLFGGAIILEKSNGLKSVKNILQDSEDNYMISECGLQNQYFIISLKEEIQLDTIQFVNMELYSSTINNFKIYASVLYPTDEWDFLGQFQAQDTNQWQTFQTNPNFLRYLKIHIIDFHKNDHYCIITQVKVFGQTVIGDLVESHKRLKNDFKQVETSDRQTSNHQYQTTKKIETIDDDLNEDEIIEFPVVNYNGYCDRMDIFFMPQQIEHQKRQLKNSNFEKLRPYATNQSLFKVTAENIYIISHNQDLLKDVVSQVQTELNFTQIYLQKLENKIQQLNDQIQLEREVNQIISQQMMESRLYFYIGLLGTICLNIILIIMKCSYETPHRKHRNSIRSAISLRNNDISDESESESSHHLKTKNGNSNHQKKKNKR
ncbi:hypothetical protein pb186bvf_004732 [Paramecium bursaria]